MDIRKATIEDYKILCKLKRELIVYQHSINPENKCNEQKFKSSDEMIKTYLERDYSIFFMEFVDNKAVGFIHGTIDPKPQEHIQAYVQELFVEKEHRGKGIGTALLSRLHTHFKKNKVTAGLSTDKDNKETIDFYLKRGYKISKVEGKIVYLIQE